MKKAPHLIANVIGLKVGWLACVLGGANGAPYLGPLVVAGIIAVHLGLSRYPRAELRLIALASLLGLAWDSALVTAGLMQYPSGTVWPGFAPYWIVAMWALFATSLNVSLTWLKGNPVLASVFGAVGGAFAFYGGYGLGGVNIPALVPGLAAQAAGWAILMPLLTVLAGRHDGVGPIMASAGAQREGAV